MQWQGLIRFFFFFYSRTNVMYQMQMWYSALELKKVGFRVYYPFNHQPSPLRHDIQFSDHDDSTPIVFVKCSWPPQLYHNAVSLVFTIKMTWDAYFCPAIVLNFSNSPASWENNDSDTRSYPVELTVKGTWHDDTMKNKHWIVAWLKCQRPQP